MSRPTTNADYGGRILQMTPATSGRDVWELQIKLIGWGSGSDNDGIGGVYEPMKMTGVFDLRTAHAVMRFQKAVGLKVTGIVDSSTFQALDREAALYPAPIHQMKCPCTKKLADGTFVNDAPIFCRCGDHFQNTGGTTASAKCTGFGNAAFPGAFLLTGKTLGDGTSLSGETLDLYDKQEYPGIDKAVVWAVRALMRRAGVTRIGISSGYRCWHDNYHYCDENRWRHRKLTFHFGKAIEFFQDVDGKCAQRGADPTQSPCGDCANVRKIALTKCGFQLRWQEPDRVSVAEGTKTAKGPANPFAVHVNTVRRLNRETDDYVKTYLDSVKPLASGKTGFSFPVDLGAGIDPRTAPTPAYFGNIEKGPGGWFPMGVSRMWHGGVHLNAATGKEVYAIADGEVVGFRAGEAEDAKNFGSRNFVLLRHKLGTKDYYSLYFHLAAAADTRWLRLATLRGKKRVEAVAPCPYFVALDVLEGGTTKKRLKTLPQQGLGPGDMAEITDSAIAANTVDDLLLSTDVLAKLKDPANTYVFTTLDGKELAQAKDADSALEGKITGHEAAGLATPIRVYGGEVLGKVGIAAKDAKAAALGTFVHVEVFAAEAMMPGTDWKKVEVTEANSAPDRQALVTTLVGKSLLTQPPDKVLLDSDVRTAQEDVFQEALRAVMLTMPSGWSKMWTAALASPDCLKFMDTSASGAAFDDYAWWEAVKGDGVTLPDAPVNHYHPIAAIVAMVAG